MAKYFNVVIVCQFDNCGQKREQFIKYHNIKPDRLRKFWQFVRTIPDLHHINFYDRDKPKKRNFIKQVKAKDIFDGTACV